MNSKRKSIKVQKMSVQSMSETQYFKGLWKENLGKYLTDISKYIVTGVIITSLFKDVTEGFVIYLLGAIIALSTLVVGLVLTNKREK